jgi:hypothetical protein
MEQAFEIKEVTARQTGNEADTGPCVPDFGNCQPTSECQPAIP